MLKSFQRIILQLRDSAILHQGNFYLKSIFSGENGLNSDGSFTPGGHNNVMQYTKDSKVCF